MTRVFPILEPMRIRLFILIGLIVPTFSYAQLNPTKLEKLSQEAASVTPTPKPAGRELSNDIYELQAAFFEDAYRREKTDLTRSNLLVAYERGILAHCFTASNVRKFDLQKTSTECQDFTERAFALAPSMAPALCAKRNFTGDECQLAYQTQKVKEWELSNTADDQISGKKKRAKELAKYFEQRVKLSEENLEQATPANQTELQARHVQLVEVATRSICDLEEIHYEFGQLDAATQEREAIRVRSVSPICLRLITVLEHLAPESPALPCVKFSVVAPQCRSNPTNAAVSPGIKREADALSTF